MSRTNETVRLRAVRMSNRQYGQLRYLLAARRNTVGIEEISNLNQLTLGGNKRRNWITETADGEGIELTPDGKAALSAFENGDFLRQVASMKFSSFLSLNVYDEANQRRGRPIFKEEKASRRKPTKSVLNINSRQKMAKAS